MRGSATCGTVAASTDANFKQLKRSIFMNELLVVALFVVVCVAVSAFNIWMEMRHPTEATPEAYRWWYLPM
jgi:hypothetical protein